MSTPYRKHLNSTLTRISLKAKKALAKEAKKHRSTMIATLDRLLGV